MAAGVAVGTPGSRDHEKNDGSNEGDWNTSHMDNTSITPSVHRRHINSLAVFLITFIMLIGAFGNGLVFFVARKKAKQSPFNFFLSVLSMLDLAACVTQIPLDLTTLLNPFYSSVVVPCSITGILGGHTVAASSVILSSVAYFRFSIVCNPHTSTFNVSDAKKVCIVALILPLGIAWPAVFIFDIRVLAVGDGYYYSDCGISKTMEGTLFPHAFYGLFFVICTISAVTMTVCYVRVARTLKRRMNVASVRFVEEERIQIVLIKITPVALSEQRSVSGRAIQSGKPKRAFALMVCVTVLFCASFVPHILLIVMCLTSDRSHYADAIDPTTYSVLLRSYFLSNFLNPFLYGFYHREFTIEMKQILGKWLSIGVNI